MDSGHRETRLQIMLSEDESQAIDDWRFKERMPSRAAAIRELIRRGLASGGFILADSRKSTDYDVMDGRRQLRNADTDETS